MDFWDFIDQNKHVDTNSLRLAIKKSHYDFDIDSAIVQIECRKKYDSKLNHFLSYPRFLFPDVISAQQSSHQAVGKYHSSLISNEHNLLDMTAGLGIDSFSFAEKNLEITAIELNPEKAETLNKNAKTLGLTNLKVISGDSINFLKETKDTFDIIFIDPSRRDIDDDRKRLYNLRDCGPDVITYQDLLFQKTKKVLIKASPLLDVTQTLKDFKNIAVVRAVGVKGECKEILIELISNYTRKTLLEAVNLDNEGEIIWKFSVDNPQSKTYDLASVEELTPGAFILEPSAMIMKLAPWEELCSRFKAKKLGISSNLFVSSEMPETFPGRVTQFIKTLQKQDRKSLKELPATVVSKNHPLSPQDLRKVFRLKEGDQNFIYATRIGEKPIIFLTRPISDLR